MTGPVATWIADLLTRLEGSTAAARGGTKINLITVAGTGALNPKVGAANFPAEIAQALVAAHPTVFNWVAIPYPAAFPFGWSVNTGVAMTRAAIKSSPGHFVGIGYSQGGMVWSQIFKDLQTGGRLASRNSDWLGTAVLGNPCRKAGQAYIGDNESATVALHGIADAAHRLTITDSRWQEYTLPGDLASAIGDDLTGEWLTLLFMAVWGGTNPAAAVTKTLKSSPVDLSGFLPEVLVYFGLDQVSGAAHTQYDTYVPATVSGVANVKTLNQLAVDYIAGLA